MSEGPQALINARDLLKCAHHSLRSSFVSADNRYLQRKIEKNLLKLNEQINVTNQRADSHQIKKIK